MNDEIVLGIETSGILCSVAWWQKDEILLEYNIEKKNAHATLLANLVNEGLNKLSLSPESVGLVAIAAGPGSFTGLRIGMAYAKGYCFGLNIPMVPVTNFEILAFCIQEHDAPVLALIEARKGYYYVGKFAAGQLVPNEQYIAESQEIIRLLSPEIYTVVHEEVATGFFRSLLPDISKQMVIQGRYSAATICALGHQKFKQNEQWDIDKIEPAYLQPFAGVL